jgi:hypothetical protein
MRDKKKLLQKFNELDLHENMDVINNFLAKDDGDSCRACAEDGMDQDRKPFRWENSDRNLGHGEMNSDFGGKKGKFLKDGLGSKKSDNVLAQGGQKTGMTSANDLVTAKTSKTNLYSKNLNLQYTDIDYIQKNMLIVQHKTFRTFMKNIFDLPITELEVLEYLFSTIFNNGYGIDIGQFLLDPFLSNILIANNTNLPSTEISHDTNFLKTCDELFSEFDFYDIEGSGLINLDSAAKIYYEYSAKLKGFSREGLENFGVTQVNNKFVTGCGPAGVFSKMFDYMMFLAELGRKSTEYDLNDVLYNKYQDKIDRD